jgi:hypothetical protein
MILKHLYRYPNAPEDLTGWAGYSKSDDEIGKIEQLLVQLWNLVQQFHKCHRRLTLPGGFADIGWRSPVSARLQPS